MEELRMALDLLLSEGLSEIIISNPRQKEGTVKVKIRPVLLKEQLMFQITRFRGKQVFHENYDRGQTKEEIEALLAEDFRQLEGENRGRRLIVLVSRKGKMTVKWSGKQTKMQPVRAAESLSHNRKKKYLLEEGIPVPFLVDLGVQTPDGRIGSYMPDMTNSGRSTGILNLWRISFLFFQRMSVSISLILAAACPI